MTDLVKKLDQVEEILKHQPGRHNQQRHAGAHHGVHRYHEEQVRQQLRDIAHIEASGGAAADVVKSVTREVGGENWDVEVPLGMQSSTRLRYFRGDKTGEIGDALTNSGFNEAPPESKWTPASTKTYRSGNLIAKTRYREGDNDTRFEVQDEEAARRAEYGLD